MSLIKQKRRKRISRYVPFWKIWNHLQIILPINIMSTYSILCSTAVAVVLVPPFCYLVESPLKQRKYEDAKHTGRTRSRIDKYLRKREESMLLFQLKLRRPSGITWIFFVFRTACLSVVSFEFLAIKINTWRKYLSILKVSLLRTFFWGNWNTEAMPVQLFPWSAFYNKNVCTFTDPPLL